MTAETSPTPEPSQPTEAVKRLLKKLGHDADCTLLVLGNTAYPERCDCSTRELVAEAIAAARPEPPVEGALEEAWTAHQVETLKGRSRSHGAAARSPRHAIRADFDAGVVAARSGHDGLREAKLEAALLNIQERAGGYIAAGEDEPRRLLRLIRQWAARALSSDPEA